MDKKEAKLIVDKIFISIFEKKESIYYGRDTF